MWCLQFFDFLDGFMGETFSTICPRKTFDILGFNYSHRNTNINVNICEQYENANFQ